MGNGGKWAWLQLGTHEAEDWVMRSGEPEWVGKGWEGHAAGVGFIPQEEDRQGRPPAGSSPRQGRPPVKATAEVQGRG